MSVADTHTDGRAALQLPCSPSMSKTVTLEETNADEDDEVTGPQKRSKPDSGLGPTQLVQQARTTLPQSLPALPSPPLPGTHFARANAPPGAPTTPAAAAPLFAQHSAAKSAAAAGSQSAAAATSAPDAAGGAASPEINSSEASSDWKGAFCAADDDPLRAAVSAVLEATVDAAAAACEQAAEAHAERTDLLSLEYLRQVACPILSSANSHSALRTKS